jgi:hypothetical protein
MKEIAYELESTRVDRRLRDRRRPSFKGFVLGGLFRGRRREPRRCADGHAYYVDWYDDPRLFAVVMGIFILNCMDAVFTLTLLSKGAEEINYFMAVLLETSIPMFVNIKLGITAVALVFLVAHSAFRLIGFVRVRHLLYGIFGNYLALFFYELSMLARVA